MHGTLESVSSSMRGDGVQALERAYRDCETRFGRPATDVEVCEELGIELQDFYQQLERYRWLRLGKIERVERPGSGKTEAFVRYVPFTWDQEVCYEFSETEFRTSLSQAINALPRNELLVLVLRYGKRLTLAKIADLFGFSKNRVAQIHTSAILRIRPKLHELRGIRLCSALESVRAALAS